MANNMNFETRRYHLTGITRCLGSQPMSDTVRTDYILAKHPEVDASGEIVPTDNENSGATAFFRDPKNNICLMDYQVRGFFKSALTALKADLGIPQPQKKVDIYCFVEDRYIPFIRNGRPIKEEDEMLERPLRAQTMQGERVSLASSETIETPWEIEFSVTLLHNVGTKANPHALTFEAIETALDYGRFSGIGQWRNAGNGRFTWKEVK